MGVLIDTNILSLALRRRQDGISARESAVVRELSGLLARREAFLLGAVRQEVMSGIRDEHTFEAIRDQLRGVPPASTTALDYEVAAVCANRCISRGIAYSSTDMLLCAISETQEHAIFTLDRDFERYAEVLPISLHSVNPQS